MQCPRISRHPPTSDLTLALCLISIHISGKTRTRWSRGARPTRTSCMRVCRQHLKHADSVFETQPSTLISGARPSVIGRPSLEVARINIFRSSSSSLPSRPQVPDLLVAQRPHRTGAQEHLPPAAPRRANATAPASRSRTRASSSPSACFRACNISRVLSFEHPRDFSVTTIRNIGTRRESLP
jgi:hypothetical protein